MGCLQSKDQKLAAEIEKEFEKWQTCPGAAPDARDDGGYRALYDDVCAVVPALLVKFKDPEFKARLKSVTPDGKTVLDDLGDVPGRLRLARLAA